MKKIILTFLVLASFCGWTCRSSNQDSKFREFLSDSDQLTKDIVTTVKANPTAFGVEEAQKILAARQPGLRTKFNDLKTIQRSQVSNETMKILSDSLFTNINSVKKLKLDYAEKSFKDKVFGDKIDKLVTDFKDLFEF